MASIVKNRVGRCTDDDWYLASSQALQGGKLLLDNESIEINNLIQSLMLLNHLPLIIFFMFYISFVAWVVGAAISRVCLSICLG